MFDFKSLPEFSKLFPDEQACITFLEKERWGNHVVSPFVFRSLKQPKPTRNNQT